MAVGSTGVSGQVVWRVISSRKAVDGTIKREISPPARTGIVCKSSPLLWKWTLSLCNLITYTAPRKPEMSPGYACFVSSLHKSRYAVPYKSTYRGKILIKSFFKLVGFHCLYKPNSRQVFIFKMKYICPSNRMLCIKIIRRWLNLRGKCGNLQFTRETNVLKAYPTRECLSYSSSTILRDYLIKSTLK